MRLVYFPIIEPIRNLAEPLLYDMLSIMWFALRVDIIVMLGCYFPPALIIPKLLRKVTIVHVDGLERNRRKFGRFLRFLLKHFEGLNSKIADYIIVDSRNIGEYYRQNYRISPIYIPNGIKEIKPLQEEALSKFKISKNQYYLVIARLEPENNIDTIVKEFKKSRSNKKLIVVGPLINNDYIRELLQHREDRIIFLGGIYDPKLQRTLRHNCFAYIHGHEVGGTNPSLVEALSCNNKILALDCIYNREVAEGSALYFSKKSNDLKEKIETLEGMDKNIPLLKDAYAIYKRKYTVEHMNNAFIKFIFHVTKTHNLLRKHLNLEERK